MQLPSIAALGARLGVIAAAASLAFAVAAPVRAEVKEVRIAKQFGLPYLPLIVAQEQGLQLAASRVWGIEQYTKLDALTVSLPHPEATAAILSGKSEVTANFAVAPFSYQQIASPNVHVVTTSDEILGGPATNTFLYATSTFRDANPKVFRAVYEAVEQAHAFIASNKPEVARIYVKVTGSRQTADEIQQIIENPAQRALLRPSGTFAQAEFLHRIGTLKNKPTSWKDYTFPELHHLAGS